MRTSKKAPDVTDILPSVRARGVLVPLLVRPNGDPDQFEVVAGRRRLFAAQAVAEESGESGSLPCAIIEADDDAAAVEASLIENIVRLAPDEVTQWETFTRLIKEGRPVADIAATFGITEPSVKRILALGNLLPRIRSLYRKEKIDAATMRHLTLATKVHQRDWLTLYDDPNGCIPTGSHLRHWLFGGQPIPTSAALFELTEYTGPIISDLFGDDSYFAESDAFWSLQRLAIEAKRQSYLDAGWSTVEMLEIGQSFLRWEHEKRPKCKGGKVYITTTARGEVEVHEGWLPAKEARRQERGEAPAKPSRPEVTSSLQNYLDLHRHAAVRAKLTEHPKIALRLMLAHAITGSALWSVRPEPQRTDKAATAESVETSLSETLFDEKRRDVLRLLGFEPEAINVVGNSIVSMTGVLDRLLPLSDEEVLAILSVVMGETLQAGGAEVEAIGVYLDLEMSSVWQADNAFFELVRDKKILTAIVAEVAGGAVATANANEKGKVMKAVIGDCLAGRNGREKVANWVPTWLRFPAGSYAERGGATATVLGR